MIEFTIKVQMVVLVYYYFICIMIIYDRQVQSFISTLPKHKQSFTKISSSMNIENSNYQYLMIPDVDNIMKKVRYQDEGADRSSPPIVIFIGTGQTLDSYLIHKTSISKYRRIIIIELRGQGDTDLDSNYCTINQYVQDVTSIFNLLHLNKIHLCGFSFGARIALSYTSIYPDNIEKLSLTGIPYIRPPLGNLILQSWLDSLSNNHNMIDCSWSFILNGYSTDYLIKYENKIPQFVQILTANNNPVKVYNLIKLSNIPDIADYYSIPQCVDRLQHLLNHNNNLQIQIIASTQDRIAGYESVQDFTKYLINIEFITMDTGHLAPFEKPSIWRKHILDFFSK